ncbi:MAG: nucleoid-associated protein [Eggerthellaceae bacterium]|nr:nucleoid-associated protein [Eggerthellaceae bacterium]
MKVNHAILHAFDFVSCVNTYAQVELDLANKNAKRYAEGHARHALKNLDAKRGTFAAESLFAEELRAYFRGQRDFVELSVQIAEFVAGELGRMEKAESTDLLVVDFEDDPNDAVREMTDEEADAAYHARGRRFFALFLLESKPAYLHEIGATDLGDATVGVGRHRAILPNPSQKVASFALIDAETLAVSFCDKPRKVAGEERMIIPDGLLQCSTEASPKEMVQTVTRLVEEVAAEYGENTTVALSKAKAYVADAVADDEEVLPWEVGREVFGEDSPCERRFKEAALAEALPERMPVERAVAERVAKKHKIRTDTGIEVTFPAEYGENPDFIEFLSGPDGLISIELKNITSIENR